MRRALVLLAALWLAPLPARAEGLVDAVREGDRAAIDRLLAREDTDVDARDAQGGTALHWAAFHGRTGLVERLLARGAAVDLKVANGNTPLHQAAYSGHEEIVQRLVASGARVDARNDRGYTPLHWAARNGHAAAAIVLIGAGASRDAPADDGTTPRTLAKSHGHRHLVRTLEMAAPTPAVPRPARTRDASDVTTAEVARTPEPATGRNAQTHRVQLAASIDEGQAMRAWAKLRQDHAGLLGTLDLFLDQVPRAGGGTWYRVRTEAMDEQRARRLCAELERRRVDCLVSRRH